MSTVRLETGTGQSDFPLLIKGFYNHCIALHLRRILAVNKSIYATVYVCKNLSYGNLSVFCTLIIGKGTHCIMHRLHTRVLYEYMHEQYSYSKKNKHTIFMYEYYLDRNFVYSVLYLYKEHRYKIHPLIPFIIIQSDNQAINYFCSG